MKLIRKSTDIFLETIDRQAYVRNKAGEIIKVLDAELDSVFKKYAEGNIKLQDYVIEIAASVASSTSVAFLDESDTKKIGIKNLAQAKLDPNVFFCPTSIQMLGVEGLGGVTDADLQAAEYGAIDAMASVTNGQIDFKVNDGEYLLRELVSAAFIGISSAAGQDSPKGLIILDNTTIMKPQFRNELTLKTAIAMPANAAVKFLIRGTRTVSTNK